MNIAHLDQGGLTLADRDYYLKQDAKMVEVRGKYMEHIQRLLTLAGETPKQAEEDAKTILALETKIAEASMDRVARRDPKNTRPQDDGRRTGKARAGDRLSRVISSWWVRAELDSLNVANPEYFPEAQRSGGLRAD